MSDRRTLDISRLPTSATWAKNPFDLPSLIMDSRVSIETMMATGLTHKSASFGFAMANPFMEHYADPTDVWDNPENLVWFVAGWGPEWDRHVANAVRELRAAVREMTCTLNLLTTTWDDELVLDTSKFQDIVASAEPDGSFAWGDFPSAGAVRMDMAGQPFFGAASACNQLHNDGIAGFLMSLVLRKIAEIDETPFGKF